MNTNWHSCKNHEVEIQRGRGPHTYELRCKVCDKHLQWLSTRSTLHLMSDLVKIKSTQRTSGK